MWIIWVWKICILNIRGKSLFNYEVLVKNVKIGIKVGNSKIDCILNIYIFFFLV